MRKRGGDMASELKMGNPDTSLLRGLTPTMQRSIERQAGSSALVIILMPLVSIDYVSRSLLGERGRAPVAIFAAVLLIIALFVDPAWSRRMALRRDLRHHLVNSKRRWNH